MIDDLIVMIDDLIAMIDDLIVMIDDWSIACHIGRARGLSFIIV